MIYLAVDSRCHGCNYFKVEDVVNEVGNHALMCSLRQTCWEKQRAYLTSCDGDVGADSGVGKAHDFCDICEMDLTGLGD